MGKSARGLGKLSIVKVAMLTTMMTLLFVGGTSTVVNAEENIKDTLSNIEEEQETREESEESARELLEGKSYRESWDIINSLNRKDSLTENEKIIKDVAVDTKDNILVYAILKGVGLFVVVVVGIVIVGVGGERVVQKVKKIKSQNTEL